MMKYKSGGNASWWQRCLLYVHTRPCSVGPDRTPRQPILCLGNDSDVRLVAGSWAGRRRRRHSAWRRTGIQLGRTERTTAIRRTMVSILFGRIQFQGRIKTDSVLFVAMWRAKLARGGWHTTGLVIALSGTNDAQGKAKTENDDHNANDHDATGNGRYRWTKSLGEEGAF